LLILIRLASGTGLNSRFPNFIALSSEPVASSVVQSKSSGSAARLGKPSEAAFVTG